MNTNLVTKKNNEQLMKRLFISFIFLASFFMFLFMFENVAFALDPVQSINKLQTLFGNIIKGIGGIAMLIGVLIAGIGFQSHDPSQKTTGIVTVIAGLIVFCATWIVQYITAE